MVFVREGEGVIIQEPVYYPFRAGIEAHGRRVVNNPLVEGLDSDGRLAYSIDFEGLEAAASGEDVRMMLFSQSPQSRGARMDFRRGALGGRNLQEA